MYPMIKLYLMDDDHARFFGEGPYQLLKAIEKAGSLRSAALSMKMAYSKATFIMKHAESALGFLLTTKSIGGKGGGGSVLTPKAKEFLLKYEQYKTACLQANQQIYHEIFSEQS
ncbi:MAG TPA: hypothetical protein VJY54_07410 [Lachnospiraceae bacterium]|nr:hypothetical protein [Lachnospiraceae bacterium]